MFPHVDISESVQVCKCEVRFVKHVDTYNWSRQETCFCIKSCAWWSCYFVIHLFLCHFRPKTCPKPECKTRGRKGPSMPKFYCCLVMHWLFLMGVTMCLAVFSVGWWTSVFCQLNKLPVKFCCFWILERLSWGEYCDMFLTHSGLTGRRQHLTGRRHINNKQLDSNFLR